MYTVTLINESGSVETNDLGFRGALQLMQDGFEKGYDVAHLQRQTEHPEPNAPMRPILGVGSSGRPAVVWVQPEVADAVQAAREVSA